jgi:hypothetical protein
LESIGLLVEKLLALAILGNDATKQIMIKTKYINSSLHFASKLVHVILQP